MTDIEARRPTDREATNVRRFQDELHNSLIQLPLFSRRCLGAGWGLCVALLLSSLTASMLLPVAVNYAGASAIARGAIEAAVATAFVTLVTAFASDAILRRIQKS